MPYLSGQFELLYRLSCYLINAQTVFYQNLRFLVVIIVPIAVTRSVFPIIIIIVPIAIPVPTFFIVIIIVSIAVTRSVLPVFIAIAMLPIIIAASLWESWYTLEKIADSHNFPPN
jgi:hypothetical protein